MDSPVLLLLGLSVCVGNLCAIGVLVRRGGAERVSWVVVGYGLLGLLGPALVVSAWGAVVQRQRAVRLLTDVLSFSSRGTQSYIESRYDYVTTILTTGVAGTVGASVVLLFALALAARGAKRAVEKGPGLAAVLSLFCAGVWLPLNSFVVISYRVLDDGFFDAEVSHAQALALYSLLKGDLLKAAVSTQVCGSIAVVLILILLFRKAEGSVQGWRVVGVALWCGAVVIAAIGIGSLAELRTPPPKGPFPEYAVGDGMGLYSMSGLRAPSCAVYPIPLRVSSKGMGWGPHPVELDGPIGLSYQVRAGRIDRTAPRVNPDPDLSMGGFKKLACALSRVGATGLDIVFAVPIDHERPTLGRLPWIEMVHIPIAFAQAISPSEHDEDLTVGRFVLLVLAGKHRSLDLTQCTHREGAGE